MTLQQQNAEAIFAKKYDRLANQTAPKSPETIGFYAGWDYSRNLHTATLRDGNTVWGNMLSTGSVGIGDPVTVAARQCQCYRSVQSYATVVP